MINNICSNYYYLLIIIIIDSLQLLNSKWMRFVSPDISKSKYGLTIWCRINITYINSMSISQQSNEKNNNTITTKHPTTELTRYHWYVRTPLLSLDPLGGRGQRAEEGIRAPVLVSSQLSRGTVLYRRLEYIKVSTVMCRDSRDHHSSKGLRPHLHLWVRWSNTRHLEITRLIRSQ